ncbi:Lung seven transmembrane receptor family protein [Forsythia ovata]|uniref:Lung seven transmembrane receptor family protein n=1 Tax=Forsythia ovata TaxID=205694 RepID=A0ABD1W981_9LAMI
MHPITLQSRILSLHPRHLDPHPPTNRGRRDHLHPAIRLHPQGLHHRSSPKTRYKQFQFLVPRIQCRSVNVRSTMYPAIRLHPQANCLHQLKVSMNVCSAMYNLENGKSNHRDYLSAGKTILPRQQLNL